MLAENIFDREVEPGKYFYCEDGQVFKSIRELENELKNCSVERCRYLFDKYVPENKNDFSNWIGGVFGLKELADRIYFIRDPKKFSKALADYEDEINKKFVSNATVPDSAKSEDKLNISQKNEPNELSNEQSKESTEKLKVQISDRLERSDQQFDKIKKIKQHSFYNKADFEDSVENLRSRYDEINHSITEHRKEGKDLSIPAMMLRNVLPKINYFQISQNRADYDKIVELLDNVEKEINYSKEVKNKDLKEEIMEALGIFKNKKED